MNVLYKINEDFSLCTIQTDVVKEMTFDHILINYRNENLFYILGGFEKLLENIKRYPEDTDYIIRNLYDAEHINFLTAYCKFTSYCINNLNFSEDNFEEDFAKFIIKILKNLVFI